MHETIETYESEVRSYCRKFPVVFERAKGPYLFDTDGKKYIDFFCGASSLNYGHNNDFIKSAVMEYMANDGIVHGLDMTTRAKIDFIGYFEEVVIKPRGLNYKILFPGPTGTNAVEAALKIARKYTGRQSVWAFMGAFHGMTLGSLALTSDSYCRQGAGVSLNDVLHIPAPYMLPDVNLIESMRVVLRDDHSGLEIPAAIVVETTQAEGGVWSLSNEFLFELRRLCDEYGILMIVDDIQVGCWRTGSFFSFERARIEPDIVTMSKSLSGMGLPFAVTLLKPEFDCLNPGEHNGTFRGNQLAMVASKASIEYAYKIDIESRVNDSASVMRERLVSLASELGITARGIGMLWAIQLESGDQVKSAIRKCFENGLIVEACGRGDSALKLMPTLVIDQKTLEEGLEIIADAVEVVVKDELF